jgi:hypothetical protein
MPPPLQLAGLVKTLVTKEKRMVRRTFLPLAAWHSVRTMRFSVLAAFNNGVYSS